MSYQNSGQSPFHYLTDGDGFPTNIKHKYWKSFGYSDRSLLENFGVRTIAQETVGNSDYRGRLITTENDNPLYWRNCRNNAPQRGKINYIPLRPDEAVKVYWLFRGVEVNINKVTLKASAKGAVAQINPLTYFDTALNLLATNFNPRNRIWNSATGGTGFGYSRRDDPESVVWDSLGNTAGASVRSSGNVYISSNNLIRFPKSGALPDFGFDKLFEYNAGESVGVSFFGSWTNDGYDSQGNCRTFVDLEMGSIFYYDEDPDPVNNGYFDEEDVTTIEKINFEGVPLLVKKRKVLSQQGGQRGALSPIDANIQDVIYEEIKS